MTSTSKVIELHLISAQFLVSIYQFYFSLSSQVSTHLPSNSPCSTDVHQNNLHQAGGLLQYNRAFPYQHGSSCKLQLYPCHLIPKTNSTHSQTTIQLLPPSTHPPVLSQTVTVHNPTHSPDLQSTWLLF